MRKVGSGQVRPQNGLYRYMKRRIFLLPGTKRRLLKHSWSSKADLFFVVFVCFGLCCICFVKVSKGKAELEPMLQALLGKGKMLIWMTCWGAGVTVLIAPQFGLNKAMHTEIYQLNPTAKTTRLMALLI